jgi:hypothetical protein
MTIQTLFDRMSLYDNQLSLIVGGDDVTRALTAINLVQDWWEMRAALRGGACQTADTFTTTANTETTTWPTNLMRLDSLFRLDANGYQVAEMHPIQRDGGHRPGLSWLARISAGVASVGAPGGFYAKGQAGLIYWAPTPDAVYTMRGYGLWAADDYTAAANTFAYPDAVALGIVPFAVKLFRTGLDRDLGPTHQAANAAFDDALDLFENQVDMGADSRVYTEFHDT